MQKLMTKELERKIPALYTQESEKDPMVYAHYFSCINGWDWYLTEYDPASGEAFGFVEGFASEWGYFSIPEFEQLNRAKLIAFVERDAWFTPKPFSKIRR